MKREKGKGCEGLSTIMIDESAEEDLNSPNDSEVVFIDREETNNELRSPTPTESQMERSGVGINEIRPIDRTVVHRICSGQVIVTLSTAVKELVENSIDAGATSVEIRLTDHGSKLIEVIDNGVGVDESNFEGLALKHHTSKLHEFEDLTSIGTFGFRGEALSSLCALASLSVVTKSDAHQGYKIEYNSRGRISSKVPVARSRGTTVSLRNIFSPLPVRFKEFLKHLKREFNKMVGVLYGYCLIASGVRISCTNQVERAVPAVVLSSPASPNMRERIASVFGAKQLSTLLEITEVEDIDPDIMAYYGLDEKSVENKRFQLSGYVSQPNSGRSCGDRQFFFINSRPCEPVKISRLVNEVYHTFSRSQYPFICLHIQTQQENVDVNVTPDKRMIYLQNEKILYATIKATLIDCLASASSSFNTSQEPVSFKVSRSRGTSTTVSTRFAVPAVPQSPSSPFSFRSRNYEIPSFAPQFSGTGKGLAVATGRKTDIRSMLSKFSHGSPASRGGNSPSLRTPHKSMFKKGAKQPKLMDFISSRARSFSHTSEPELSVIEEIDISVSEDIMIVDEQPATSIEIETEVDEDDKVQSMETLAPSAEVDDTDEVEQVESQDYAYFSQSSTETEDSEGSQEITIYDDEVDETEYNNESEPLPYSQPSTKSNSFQLNWKAVLDRLKNSSNDVGKNFEASARRFRANISPNDNASAEKELQKQLTKEMFSEMKIIGQFNLGFIIAKHGPDLFIVDQHASDEKYNFEDLQKSTVLQGQKLISPMPLQLSAVSENVIIDNLQTFQKNGFSFDIRPEAEPTKRISLTKIPYSRSCQFGRQDLDELVFMLEDAPENSYCRPSRVRDMFASRACRKSVMIGTSLSPKEMKTVVSHMGSIEQPWNCPHGRPTIRHLLNLNLLPKNDLGGFNH